MNKTDFTFLDVLTRMAELKIEQLFNEVGMICVLYIKFFLSKPFFSTSRCTLILIVLA